jgi:hypothetical protein
MAVILNGSLGCLLYISKRRLIIHHPSYVFYHLEKWFQRILPCEKLVIPDNYNRCHLIAKAFITFDQQGTFLLRFGFISGSYGMVVVKLKTWLRKLIKIAHEYTEP